MSRWKDQISKHPIFAAIDQCKEWIETGLENRPEDADPQVEIEARRLLKILSAIRSTIIEMDAEFVPKPIVDSLNTHLRNAGHWNQLTAFSANSELSSIQNANNHIDSQLNSVSVLVSASASLASPRADLIEDRYDSFVGKSSTQLKNLKETVSKNTDMAAAVSERMNRAAEELDGLEESFQKKLNDWNTAFTERSNARSEEFNDAQISRKKEFETLGPVDKKGFT